MNVTKVPEGAPSQRAASETLDKKTLDRLIDQGNDREKQRLRRLDCKHANSWITSLPSATDGRDTIMDPKIYSTAVARLLGLPVYNNSIPCPLCQQSMDVLGDHALCCKKTQDTITRHNRVRNLMFKLGDWGNPQMEKLGRWALRMTASVGLGMSLLRIGGTAAVLRLTWLSSAL